MAMRHYACESMAYIVAGSMDRKFTDYHLEAAISKVIPTAGPTDDIFRNCISNIVYLFPSVLLLKLLHLLSMKLFKLWVEWVSLINELYLFSDKANCKLFAKVL